MPTKLFQKGQSGNPAGKPVGTRSVQTLFREAIEKIGKDLKIEDVERNLITALLTKASKGDMKALEMYLDRLYGKPKSEIDLGGTLNLNQNIVIKLPEEEEDDEENEKRSIE